MLYILMIILDITHYYLLMGLILMDLSNLIMFWVHMLNEFILYIMLLLNLQLCTNLQLFTSLMLFLLLLPL